MRGGGQQRARRRKRKNERTGSGEEEPNRQTDRDLDQARRRREAGVGVAGGLLVVACELEQAAVTQSTGELEQYTGSKEVSANALEGTAKERNSPDDHDDERRSMSELAVDVAEEANDKGPNGRTDVGAADKDLAREVVARESCTTGSASVRFATTGKERTGTADQDHDDGLLSVEGLAVPQTQHEEVARDRKEDCRGRQRSAAAFERIMSEESAQNHGGIAALYQGAPTRNAEHV